VPLFSKANPKKKVVKFWLKNTIKSENHFLKVQKNNEIIQLKIQEIYKDNKSSYTQGKEKKELLEIKKRLSDNKSSYTQRKSSYTQQKENEIIRLKIQEMHKDNKSSNTQGKKNEELLEIKKWLSDDKSSYTQRKENEIIRKEKKRKPF
jgi:hypothetical protein